MIGGWAWAVIWRRDYVDLVIEGQPFNSVEILFHIGTKRTIVLCG